MAPTEPGEPAAPPAGPAASASSPARPARGNRRLAEAPGARFAERSDPVVDVTGTRSALAGSLVRASVLAVIGAVVLVLLGSVLASTTGLLFAAGVTGGAIGLVLARAAVPMDDARPVPRRTLSWLAIGVVLVAIVAADLATWIVARGEGGTLGPLEYLLDAFGLFVPGELLLGALGAWWGARSGPVKS